MDSIFTLFKVLGIDQFASKYKIKGFDFKLKEIARQHSKPKHILFYFIIIVRCYWKGYSSVYKELV